MRLAVCLHGATVARSALGLHPTDRRAIALGRSLATDVVVVEAVGERGSAPVAVNGALGAGASRAVRVVEPALGAADSHATGLVLAAVLDHLTVDLVLFGDDADPEGLGDVPACIAQHLTALYLPGAIDLKSAGTGATTVEVSVRNAGWILRLAVPLNAVIGIAGGVPQPDPPGGLPIGTNPASVEILTFGDLDIDPALVRRRDDLRGVIEPAPRPLVTLQSAAAVGALLRRS